VLEDYTDPGTNLKSFDLTSNKHIIPTTNVDAATIDDQQNGYYSETPEQEIKRKKKTKK
jgi:hypothetical protein